MTELQHLDTVTGQWNNEYKGDQLEDEEANFADNILDLDGTDTTPEGGPSTINDGLSNMDAEMLEDYFSGLDKEDTTLSARKNDNQLRGRKISRTFKLFLERVHPLSKIPKESKKEATAARKIHLQLSFEEALIRSTEL
jgi:hypothetical protein